MASWSRRLATAFPGGKDRRPGLTRQGSDTIADPPRPTCRGADRAETLPKIATMERRWAQRPSALGRWGGTSIRPGVPRQGTPYGRLTALHPPLGGVEKDQTSGAKSRRENEIGLSYCLMIVLFDK